MEKIVLLDTNILIEILKSKQETISKIQGMDCRFAISSITQMELFFGALDKKELNMLEKFTDRFLVIDINEDISKLATKLVFLYAKSHNLNIPDALIASTAMFYDIELFTYNLKDFRYIKQLKLI